MKMSQTEVDVIIIGGGIAGLAAAGRLLQNNFKVVVLEAGNRIGGRVHTIDFGGSKIDLGAHWIGGEPVYSLASTLDLVVPSEDFSDLSLFLDDGTQIDSSDARVLLDALGEFTNDKAALTLFKGNLAQYYAGRFEEILKGVKSFKGAYVYAFINWIQRFKCIQNGCDSLFEASPTTESVPVRDISYRWKQGGYQSVIDLLMKDMEKVGASNPVKLNESVTKIDWRDTQIEVITANGSVIRAPHVVVTVSLGVLKEHYASLFVPCLPEAHVNAIKNLGIGTVNKIFLKFKTQWWPDRTSGFGLINSTVGASKSETSWGKDIIGFFTEEGHPLILTAWVVGDAAKEMELSSPEDVQNVCTRVLKQFLGPSFEVEEPECITRTTWFSNPHFKGAYSFRSMESVVHNVSASQLAIPIPNACGSLAIVFAGEATSEKYFSTAHGALESGWRAANMLMEAQ